MRRACAGPCAWRVLTAVTALWGPPVPALSIVPPSVGDRGQIRVRVVGTEDGADCVSFGTIKHLSSFSAGPAPLRAWDARSCRALRVSGRGCCFGVLSEHSERPPPRARQEPSPRCWW